MDYFAIGCQDSSACSSFAEFVNRNLTHRILHMLAALVSSAVFLAAGRDVLKVLFVQYTHIFDMVALFGRHLASGSLLARYHQLSLMLRLLLLRYAQIASLGIHGDRVVLAVLADERGRALDRHGLLID